MAFDFPSNPVDGDIFTDAVTGVTYYWTGYAWSRNAEKAAQHPPASVVPLEPPVGSYTTVQMAIEGLSAETGNKVDVAGDTMTGPLILSEHPNVASPDLQAATKGFVNSVGGLPPTTGGAAGQALVLNLSNVPSWGAAITGGSF